MRVCRVDIYLDGKQITFKRLIPPGGKICENVHDGTVILINGEPEGMLEITYDSMPSGKLIAFLAASVEANLELGIYCIRNA